MRLAMRVGSISTPNTAAPCMAAAVAARHPYHRDRPSPPVALRGCLRSAWRPPHQTFRKCPARCPDCRCRSTNRPSSARTWSGPASRGDETHPTSPNVPRDSSWRSTPVARPHACETPLPVCRSGPAGFRRPPTFPACARWHRTLPMSAPLGRYRRTRPDHRDVRQPRHRDCSSTCATRLPAPIHDSAGCYRGGTHRTGTGGRRSSR